MAIKKLSAAALVREIDLDRYLPRPKEKNTISKACRSVFVSQIKSTYDRMEQVDKALSFYETIWKKYDCREVAVIYHKFVKMEEALYGLERDEKLGKRYRDHSIHMFNCFAFGLRIISSMLNQLPSAKKKKALFKVEDENLMELKLPFGEDYSYLQRLFYLWTLMSTFHDIAIPFQHMSKLGQGISKFTEEFGWVFTDPAVSMHNFDSSQLHHYFKLITSLYDGKLNLDTKKLKYQKSNNHYLAKLLGREFDFKNHGVMSGFFMWKTIEEIFLVGRDSKYPLNMDQFNTYAEYVLEQDIARIALAISLHALGEDKKSKAYANVFPIDFRRFPLTFLLILSDELQEYLRWDGSALKKKIVFNYHPMLDIKLNKTDYSVKMIVSFSLDSNMQKSIIDHAVDLAADSGNSSNISDLDDAVDVIGNSIKEALERKLLLGKKFKLKLEILEDWEIQRYSKDLISAD